MDERHKRTPFCSDVLGAQSLKESVGCEGCVHDIHFVAFSLSVNQLISKRDEEGKVLVRVRAFVIRLLCEENSKQEELGLDRR